MMYRELFSLIPIYGIFLILLTPYAYGSGAARDYDEAYEDVQGANECWYDGYADGQNEPFNEDRNEECKDKGNQYYRAFIQGCMDVEGNTDETCEKGAMPRESI